MIQHDAFWLVTRELFVTKDMDTWFPWGHPSIWTIIVVIVILGNAPDLRRAIVHVLTAIAALGGAMKEVAQALL